MRNKGQAIAELAIFGSLLLFCASILIQYAIEANYQQSTQMEAFRKALQIGFYKNGPGSAAGLILIKDKPIPDTRDQFGFAERYTMAGSGSVTWDNNLSAGYGKSFSATPDVNDLPSTYFEVGNTSNLAAVQSKATAPLDAATNAGLNDVFGVYNARFEKADCPDTITVVYADPEHIYGGDYRQETISKDQIAVMLQDGGFGDPSAITDVADDTELLMSPYYRDADGIKHKIQSADVDGDGKLETIIAANIDKKLLYIAYHGASTTLNTLGGAVQIDSDYTAIKAGDKVHGRPATPDDRQGFITDSEKTIQHTAPGSSIWKGQFLGGTVHSITNLNANQAVTHKIRLNSGEVIDVRADFIAPAGDLYRW